LLWFYFNMRIVRGVLTWFMRLFHAVQFRGAEHVPAWGPVIFAANHPSYFDPIVLTLGQKRSIRFFAIAALLDIPVLGWIVRKFGILPVVRGGDNEASVQKALRVLGRGGAVGIFPEGRRSLQPIMGDVRPGVGRLAIESGAAVVPVTIFGAYKVWPRHLAIPQPGKIVVVYHPPVRPRAGETPQQFAERVRSIIRDAQFQVQGAELQAAS
jgi:1-acyl-sn-glycerol-3-phosphate acyltransferase